MPSLHNILNDIFTNYWRIGEAKLEVGEVTVPCRLSTAAGSNEKQSKHVSRKSS